MRDVSRLEALRDVLRAIGVPGADPEFEHLLAARFVIGRHQLREQCGIVFDDASLPPDLEAAAVRVVDQKQKRLRIFREVAGGDELAGSAAVSPTQDGFYRLL